MNRMRKRSKARPAVVGRLPAVLVLALCLFSLSGCSANYVRGSKQVMENLSISATLMENGDMTVSETWKVNLQDRGRAYRNLYRSFSLDSSKADDVTDLSVYDEDRDVSYSFAGDVDPESVSGDEMQDRCYVHRSDGMLEAGWFMPAVDEGVRTFTISYRVKNIVSVYADTAVLYTFFLQDFGLPVTSLNGVIRFPQGSEKGDVQAWLHTTVSSSLNIDSADQVSFTASSIPANTSVEVRLCVPPRLFPASEKVSGEAVLSGIRAEEQKWADEYEAKLRRQFLLGLLDAGSAVLLLAVCIFLFVRLKRKNRRYRVDVPEYTRDIPPGNSPGGIANLFYFYSGLGEKEQNRMYSATLLSLARKGFVRFEGREGEFSVEVTGDTRGKKLTESEQVFYELVSTTAEASDNRFTMKEFKRYAQKHAKYVSSRMDDFLNAAKRELSDRGYYEARPALFSVSAVAGVLLLVAAVAVFAVSGSVGALLLYLPISMLISGVLFLIAGTSKMKLSQKGESEFFVWQGLKKYMLEFSRMKEYGVPQLELWEEFLVYATMMGISGEVCKQLRLAYPQLADDSYVSGNFAGSYLFYMFGPRMYWGGLSPMRGGFDFGAVLGNTFGQVGEAATRLSNPAANGGGKFGGGFGGFGGGGFGGGGFSGGGGGFGGGGGGVR